MFKSHRQLSLSSLNHSKDSSLQNSKKYRCDCCKDKKYHDYNRENRIRRQSASSKRMNLTCRQSTRYALEENNLNLPNANLISSIDNYQVKAQKESDSKKLPAIIESPHLIQQHKKQDNNSSLKTPMIDMKQYCKNLFSSGKKKKSNHKIEVQLNGERYLIEMGSNQKMKLAIGQLKLLIQNSQNIKAKIN